MNSIVQIYNIQFLIFKLILFIFCFKYSNSSAPDYTLYSLTKLNYESKILKAQSFGNFLSSIYLYDNGFVIDDNENYEYSQINLNTEFIYDMDNKILFLTCLSNNHIGKYDLQNNEMFSAQIYNNYQYNDYKCSISFQIDFEKYIILTQTYLEGNNYINFIWKVNYNLNVINSYNFTITKNENINYNNIFQCVTIEYNFEIFCAYFEEKIYGFYMNSNFNDRDNIQTLVNESPNSLYFKMFPFTDNSILIISLEDNLSTLHIKLLTSSNKQLIKRHLYIIKEETINYLDLVSINYITNYSFLLLIGKNPLTYYWCEFTETSVYFNTLIISQNNYFSTIQQSVSINLNSKIRTYIVIINDTIYELYYNDIEFPSQQMKCNKLDFYLGPNKVDYFEISDLIPNQIYNIRSLYSSIKLNSFGIRITLNYNKNTVKYVVEDEGTFSTNFFYKFYNYSTGFVIQYSALNCIINIFVCEKLCENCDEYTYIEKKCNSCVENSHISNINNGYCNICPYDYSSIWHYNDILSSSECYKEYNFCYEIQNLNKPFMIYDTFECVENCPSNYIYKIGKYCINSCNKEKMILKENECKCEDNYKFILNRINNEISCVKECPINLPLIDYMTKECVLNCPSNSEIIFNHTCFSECPKFTNKIKNGNSFTCECQFNSYEITINNLNFIGCTTKKECLNGSYYDSNTKKCVNECQFFHNDFECLDFCDNDFIKLDKLCLSIDELINNIDKYIFLFYKENYINFEKGNYFFQIYNTSLESIKVAYSIKNISQIDLGPCKNEIQKKYNLNNEELLVFKIDIFKPYLITKQVEYSLFTLNGEKIDLNICSNFNIIIKYFFNENNIININSMKSLSKQKYDIFNPNDTFYTSICSIYKNEYGTDVINNDRRKDYYQNITLCEEECNYKGLNFNDYSYKCECPIKNDLKTEDRKMKYNSLFNSFNSSLTISNFKVLKCYKEVFNFKNFFINFGQIFVTICLIIEIILSLLIIFSGIHKLFAMLLNFVDVRNSFIKQSKNYKKNKRKNNYINNTLNESESKNKKNSIVLKNNPPKKTANKNYSKKNTHITSPKYMNKSNKFPKNKLHSISKILKSNDDDDNGINLPIKIYSSSNLKNNNISSQKKNIHNQRYISQNFINSLSNSNNTLKNYEEDYESNSNISKILKNKNRISESYQTIKNNRNINIKNNNINKSNKVVFFRPQLNLIVPQKEEKMNNFIQPVNQLISKSKLINKSLSTNDNTNTKISSKITNSFIINDKYTKEEIMLMKYKLALKYDKISFLQYYWLLLKFHQLIIFTFITDTDYNLIYVKIILFIFSLNLYIVFSAIFFNDAQFTYIYNQHGKFSILIFIPKAIFSNIICSIIKYWLNKISLSQDLISKIKSKKNILKEEYKLKIKKKTKIKFALFFIILYLFLLLFWYFISVFCAIFRNTQWALFKSSFLSFIISMLYPFIFCFLSTVFRKIALKKKWKWMFKISKFLDYL